MCSAKVVFIMDKVAQVLSTDQIEKWRDGYNPGFRKLFKPGKISLGVFIPIEAYSGDLPSMQNHIQLAQQAEALGFDALWFRDVPLRDPTFGDVGQVFEPWAYLGYIAALTSRIVLATGSIVTSLRHPIDQAKAAATVDHLSGGRFVMGIASGDRPIEFPAYGKDANARGEDFRSSLVYMEALLYEDFPEVENPLGRLRNADLLPKPGYGKIPMLVTGSSRQELQWIAKHSDGWIMYPQPIAQQTQVLSAWRIAQEAAGVSGKPFAQSLYVDLLENPDAPAERIHLGYRLGRNTLRSLLLQLREIGVDHVAFNLKYSQRPASEVLAEIGEEIASSLI